MYDPTPDSRPFQGDIVRGVPVVLMPAPGNGPWILLRPTTPVTFASAVEGRQLPKAFYNPDPQPVVDGVWQEETELVLARGTKQPVMILTQTCELDKRKHYQIAPVYPVSIFPKKKQDELEANDFYYLFKLPENKTAGLPRSVVDFSRVATVHSSYFKPTNLLCRLTPESRVELQKSLLGFFGRPFGFTIKDTVAVSGEYICTHCFYAAAVATKAAMVNGEKFRSCPSCAAKAAWVLHKAT